MKKNFSNKAHLAEIGAGIGLTAVCIAVMIIDESMVPFSFFFSIFGILMATGAFSQNKSKKQCQVKNTEK